MALARYTYRMPIMLCISGELIRLAAWPRKSHYNTRPLTRRQKCQGRSEYKTSLFWIPCVVICSVSLGVIVSAETCIHLWSFTITHIPTIAESVYLLLLLRDIHVSCIHNTKCCLLPTADFLPSRVTWKQTIHFDRRFPLVNSMDMDEYLYACDHDFV